MLPVCLTRTSVDSGQWDHFIEESLQNVIYAKSWYLDIVSEDWNAIVWPPTGAYQIVLPLPLKTKWGHKVIQQPLFCQFLGFFSCTELTHENVCDFLTVLDLKFEYISSYCFNPHNMNALDAVLPLFGRLKSQVLSTYQLNLNRRYVDIYAGYNSDLKRNIRLGENQQWKLSEGYDIDLLITLFERNHASGISGGVAKNAYEILAKLYERLSCDGLSRLYYSAHNGVIRAGVLIVEDQGKSIYLFNAADAAGRKGNGRVFILNRYFSECAGQDLIFDFESPQIVNIAAFYRKFGGRETPFVSISKNDLNFPLKQLQNFRKVILTGWK